MYQNIQKQNIKMNHDELTQINDDQLYFQLGLINVNYLFNEDQSKLRTVALNFL